MKVPAAPPNLIYRVIKDRVFQALVVLFSLLTFLPLLLIIFHIVQNGIAVVDWQFLTHLPRPVGEVGGGIANAMVGTLMLIVIASVIAIPLGVCAGVYLTERKTGTVCYLVRLCVEVLHGVPSIVIGIIAYVWVVMALGTFSALAGGIALAIMMLPVIVRSTEETLKLIPDTLQGGLPVTRCSLLPDGAQGYHARGHERYCHRYFDQRGPGGGRNRAPSLYRVRQPLYGSQCLQAGQFAAAGNF